MIFNDIRLFSSIDVIVPLNRAEFIYVLCVRAGDLETIFNLCTKE